jgi:hypothetical protein
MSLSLDRKLAGLAIILILAAPSEAGLLSMRFANGTNEVTLHQSEIARIEVLFSFGAMDKVTNRLTGIDARFDVGPLVQGVGGSYVLDGPTPFAVIDVDPLPGVGWTTAASTPVPAPFAGDFFLSVGDPAGVHGAHEYTQPPGFIPPIPLATVTIRRDRVQAGDYYVVFRARPPLPALYNGPSDWQNQFGYQTITGGGQFEIGQGNPGDADPRWAYHGYETLQPLIIHAVPEPSVFALFVLAATSALRRR